MPSLPVPVGGADLLQLSRLHAVGDADLAHPPRLPAFFERGVVQVAVIGQQPGGAALLGPGWVGAELVGSFHRYRSWRSVWVTAREAGTAGPLVCRPYGPVLTSGPGHAGGRELGFRRLKAAVPSALRPMTWSSTPGLGCSASPRCTPGPYCSPGWTSC